jgi:hypothetical protein
MELFYRLAIDAGLVIFLILSIIIGNLIVSYILIGIAGLPLSLKSLSFSIVGLSLIFIGAIPFSPVIVTSYFCGDIAQALNHEFNYLDVTLILISCFACMFVVMGGLRIPEDLKRSEEARKQGWTYYLWWETIDQSLTPAVIITLLIMPGLILSCHFNGLN